MFCPSFAPTRNSPTTPFPVGSACAGVLSGLRFLALTSPLGGADQDIVDRHGPCPQRTGASELTFKPSRLFLNWCAA